MGGNITKYQTDLEAREALAQRCHELDLQVKFFFRYLKYLYTSTDCKFADKSFDRRENVSLDRKSKITIKIARRTW